MLEAAIAHNSQFAKKHVFRYNVPKELHKHPFPHPRMTAAAFQKKVRAYSHLPADFIEAIALAADKIPEDKMMEIIAELDASLERGTTILTEGYKAVADGEKKLRREAEQYGREQEAKDSDALFNTTTFSPSL